MRRFCYICVGAGGCFRAQYGVVSSEGWIVLAVGKDEIMERKIRKLEEQLDHCFVKKDLGVLLECFSMKMEE